MKTLTKIALTAATSLLLSSNAIAAPVTYWTNNGFTLFASEDTNDGTGNYQLGPGWGGQKFDAEHLYYKQEGTKLFIGLQSGFNLTTGNQIDGSRTYYSGDLALSFNNTAYNYAIDFGLTTKDKEGYDLTDPAGLYSVATWNNTIDFPESKPFAMDTSIWKKDLLGNISGSEGLSYYRVVSFDLAGLGFDLSKEMTIGAHWTMSCGNDAISGTFSPAPVPEPTTMLLFGTGLIGLAGIARRRQNA